MIKKVISGGQTGAETDALDIAIQLDIPHGGWVPKGWKNPEDRLQAKYQLQEISTTSYIKRLFINDQSGSFLNQHHLRNGEDLTRYSTSLYFHVLMMFL